MRAFLGFWWDCLGPTSSPKDLPFEGTVYSNHKKELVKNSRSVRLQVKLRVEVRTKRQPRPASGEALRAEDTCSWVLPSSKPCQDDYKALEGTPHRPLLEFVKGTFTDPPLTPSSLLGV